MSHLNNNNVLWSLKGMLQYLDQNFLFFGDVEDDCVLTTCLEVRKFISLFIVENQKQNIMNKLNFCYNSFMLFFFSSYFSRNVRLCLLLRRRNVLFSSSVCFGHWLRCNHLELETLLYILFYVCLKIYYHKLKLLF